MDEKTNIIIVPNEPSEVTEIRNKIKINNEYVEY